MELSFVNRERESRNVGF